MESVLKTIIAEKHFRFEDHVDSWQEAIRLSTLSLVADGSVEEDYYRQIVNSIEKYGPYVIFDHQVAMPHSQESVTGVYKSGIGFLRVKEPVSFGKDEEGQEKTAQLFFTLASRGPLDHLNTIQQLAALFCNEDLLDALIAAETPEAVLEAEATYVFENF